MINLIVHQFDLLEFDVDLTNEDGSPFVLGTNDNLWFIAKKSYSDEIPAINIIRHSTHFKINEVEIGVGTYLFEIGIIFEDGTEKTVVPDGRLSVKSRLKGDNDE